MALKLLLEVCVACDMPAARKVCGFVGHNALRGCSKCLTVFPCASFGEKSDYSNFNRASWEFRDSDKHRDMAMKYKNCVTKADQKLIAREYGLRYSVIARRMCVIDPMHNILLATVKNMIEIWKNMKLILILM